MSRSCRSRARLSARQCAQLIVEAFADYNAEFRAITRRAPLRFDARDSKGSQRDAVERIELYDRFVNQTIAELRLKLGERALDRVLWAQIRDEFADLIARPAGCGIHQDLLQLHHAPALRHRRRRTRNRVRGHGPRSRWANITTAVGTNTYLNHGSLLLLFEDVLGDIRFHSPGATSTAASRTWPPK